MPFALAVSKNMESGGVQYKMGLNNCTTVFSSYNSGADFFKEKGAYVVDVSIPHGATVERNGDYWTSDAVILSNLRSIKKFEIDVDKEWNSHAYQGRFSRSRTLEEAKECDAKWDKRREAYKTLKTRFLALPEDSEERVALLKQDGWLLKYVKNKTPELCLIAVAENGNAIRFVDNPTFELCMLAVQTGHCCSVIFDIPEKHKTPELLLEAVKHDCDCIEFIEDPTTEIALEAVKKNGKALHFIKNQTPEMWKYAIAESIDNLYYINSDTFKITV